MNILITNDDGPESPGLDILQEEARKHWAGSHIITLVPAGPQPGMSMATSLGDPEKWELSALKKNETDFYSMRGTPIDTVLLAFYRPDLFLPEGNAFDVVMSGVNPGKNLGMDVYFSGTVCQAMLAASAFGATGLAFSQEILGQIPGIIERWRREQFSTAEKAIETIFQQIALVEGECWNVNFPHCDAKGLQLDEVAHYSGWWKPPTKVVPRARMEKSDVRSVETGYVSLTRLMLRVNPPMQF